MAATYFTIGSKFQPYTLAEMLVPYQMYAQEYQRQEDLYNTYSDAAGQVGAQLSNEYDKDLLDNIYNPYIKAVEDASGSLAENGLTPGGRRTLNELRRQYNNNIVPIQQAVQARAEARKRWDTMYAKDSTLMTNANPYYQGVSAYMNGASPETVYVSGNELYSRGQALSQAFSKVMREVPESERLALEGQYWRIVQQFGPDSNEASQFLEGTIEAIPELANQLKGIIESSGIYSQGFTNNDIRKARQYIIEGMKAGLSGDTKVQYIQNQAYGITPEIPEVPEEEPSGLQINNFSPVRTVPRRVFNDAVSDYNAYSGMLTEGSPSDLMYRPAVVDGQEMFVSPELAAMLAYKDDPEAYVEWMNEGREKYKEYLIQENSKQPNRNSLLSDAYTINQRAKDRYPEYSQRQLEKIMKRDKERFNKLADKYSYLSDDPMTNVRLGSIIQMSEAQDSPKQFYFEEEKTADYSIKDRNYMNRINTGRVFKYDTEHGTVGKAVSKDEALKLLEADERFYTYDKKGRKLVSDGKDTFFLEGSKDDVKKQRQVEAFMDAFTNFHESGSSIDGVSVPGIGRSEGRPEVNIPENPEILQGEDFSSFIKDYGSPIMAGGNVVGYVIAVNNYDGTPYKIITGLDGICFGVTNPYSAQGDAPQQFLEDIIDITYK